MKAQLPKSTSNFETYIQSDNWAMQQKIDGWRMLLSCGDNFSTLNRKGEPLECPSVIKEYFDKFTTNWTFDGELLKDKYYIFDLLEIPTGNVQSWPLHRRYELLENISSKFDNDIISLLPLYKTEEVKREKFNEFYSSSLEGVVFKLLDGEYLNKKSPNFLKYKFVKQLDCVVIDKNFNSKDNFVLGLFDGKDFIDVGKCSSLTGDGPNVKVGDVVQVDILYTTEGNRIFQPVKPKIRTDKDPEECLISQIDEFKTRKEVFL